MGAMKIIHKVILGFLAVILLILIGGLSAVKMSQNALQRSFAESSVSLATDVMDKIDRYIYSKIEEFQLYTRDVLLQKDLFQANTEFEKLDDVQAYIDEKDREWTSVPKQVITPFMQGLLDTELSNELREKIEFYKEKYGHSVYGEVFVTNKYGANVAQTGKTTDFRQDDERWWQYAKRDGLYVKDVEYDESAGVYTVDFALRIDDEKGNFIGVIKIVMNIEDMIEIVKELESAEKKMGHKTVDFKLITKEGRAIYSTEVKGFWEIINMHDELLSATKEGKHADYFMAKGDTPEEGEEIFSYSRSKGYKEYGGLGWILVVEHETEEIFAPATKLNNAILIVSLFLTIVAILMSFFISRYIAKPVIKLRDAAKEVGKGKFDIRIKVRSNDEIGELAASFNQMTEDLEKTTVNRDYMDNILKSMYDSLVVTTPGGRIKTVNRATLRLLGYTGEELIDRPAGEIFAGPERFDELERNVLIERGYVSNIERTYLSKDGRKIPVLFSASVMHDAGGIVSGIVFVAQDITERKQMLDALGENKEKLNAMLQSITDCMSMIDKDLNIIWANEPAKKFFGEDIVGKNCCEVYYGKKEPCEPYPCIAHMVFEDGKGRKHDTRVTAKDGKTGYFHCTANVALRDKLGKPIAVLEILRDITASKMAEERLRLTSRVFENTVESIIITDANQKILQVNEAFTRITGYRPEEVTGKTPDILRSGWHDEKFYKEMWNSINQKGMWQGEVWDRRKNGEVFAGQLTISAIKDEKGSVANYVGLFYDITEKKRTEERIQHLAYYDALTNLPNRSLFYDRLEHTIASSRRGRKPVALMFLDLDNFKIINDTLGHNVGDMLLKACAGRLTECLRKDTTVARFGGDEFTVILANIKEPRDAVVVSERIKGVLSKPFTL
jgi:PAS domain S-box-containing protein